MIEDVKIFLKEVWSRYPMIITLFGILIIAGLFRSCISEALAAELPCAREERRMYQVCKKHGEQSQHCLRAKRVFERCMDESDPIGGVC